MSCLVLNTDYEPGNDGRVIPGEKTVYYLKGDTWFVYGTPVSDINFDQTKGLVKVTNPLVLECLWDMYFDQVREFAND